MPKSLHCLRCIQLVVRLSEPPAALRLSRIPRRKKKKNSTGNNLGKMVNQQKKEREREGGERKGKREREEGALPLTTGNNNKNQ